jgi:hypothetical protein
MFSEGLSSYFLEYLQSDTSTSNPVIEIAPMSAAKAKTPAKGKKNEKRKADAIA